MQKKTLIKLSNLSLEQYILNISGLFHVVQIFAALKFWLAYIHDSFYQALFNLTQYKDIRN